MRLHPMEGPDDSLDESMDAIQRLLESLATLAHGLGGPQFVRNFQAGQWLDRVGTCLDETASLLREASQVTPEKLGELACFRERLEPELVGSKFAAQLSSFRDRLDSLLGMIRTPGADAPLSARVRDVAETAGYFHAAAKSARLTISLSDLME